MMPCISLQSAPAQSVYNGRTSGLSYCDKQDTKYTRQSETRKYEQLCIYLRLMLVARVMVTYLREEVIREEKRL